MKRRITELDRRVPDGCESCVVAGEVDRDLGRQEAIVRQVVHGLSTSLPT
jgi:hypothetical protein